MSKLCIPCLLTMFVNTLLLNTVVSEVHLDELHTKGTTVTCELSAFLAEHSAKRSDYMRISLQIVLNASGNESILATLDAIAKTIWPSEFLRSMDTFYGLAGEAEDESLQYTWLNVTIADALRRLEQPSFFHCMIAYEDEDTKGTWNSTAVAKDTTSRTPGIHVTVNSGLTIECLIRSRVSTSSAFIERRSSEEDGKSRAERLCTDTDEMVFEPFRLRCNFTHTSVGGGVIVFLQAHLFYRTCDDQGTYVCGHSTLSSTRVIQFSDCAVTQSAIPASPTQKPPREGMFSRQFVTITEKVVTVLNISIIFAYFVVFLYAAFFY